MSLAGCRQRRDEDLGFLGRSDCVDRLVWCGESGARPRGAGGFLQGPQKGPEPDLVFLFGDHNRDTHSLATQNSADNAFHMKRSVKRQPAGEAGAQADAVTKLYEHSFFAEIAGAASQHLRLPRNFDIQIETVAGKETAFNRLARERIARSRLHGAPRMRVAYKREKGNSAPVLRWPFALRLQLHNRTGHAPNAM